MLLAGGLALGAGCGGDDESRVPVWDPDAAESGETGTDDSSGTQPSTGSPASDDGDEAGDSGATLEGGGACSDGDTQDCLCNDGLTLGQQTCTAGAWSACDCNGAGDDGPGDDDGGTDDGGGGETTDDGTPADEVCYPGEDNSYTTCFALHHFDPNSMPSGYDYPDALSGNPNYRKPVAFIDLREIDGATMIAPNFRLNEIAQLHKGDWAIVQPHAVESLQGLRDTVGGIGVNSGYRSPEYNAGVGGVSSSRHMYGDGFDLDPTSVPLSTLESACSSQGGMLVEYDSHVHCDFRFDDVDEGFFGSPPASIESQPLPFSASIERAGAVFWAPALGFDEGEPARRWAAYDADGNLLLEAKGLVFAAPERTAEIDVRVGAQVELHVVVD